jgi:FtsH-binding integral membrane protein
VSAEPRVSDDDRAVAARGARAYFAACAAIIGFALGYTLPVYARLPKPFYDPIGRRWFIAAYASPIPMGYVGQLAWGVGGALVCGGVALLSLSRARTPPGERAFALWGAWTLTAIAIVIGYFTWNNWP